MKVRKLKYDLQLYLDQHQLNTKFQKRLALFRLNPHYPSLNTELLEPRSAGVYSFRLNRKYQILFLIVNGEAEIIDINDHYQ